MKIKKPKIKDSMSTTNTINESLINSLNGNNVKVHTAENAIHESFFIPKPVSKAYFVLPAYNEEESLPNLLKRIAGLPQSKSGMVEVIVVDDGSKDKTADIVKQGVNGLPLRLISHKRNMGLGQAVQTGIKEAIKLASDEDIIVIMDADDTHDVTLLSKMIEKIESGSDIVIASRFVNGGDDKSAPPFRRLLSRGASFVFKTVLPLNDIKDFTSGYRAYRANMLKRVSKHWGERLIEEKGFACMVELLLKLRHWSPEITEVPFELRYDRKLGSSKLKLFRTIFQYIKLAMRDRLAPPPRRL